MLLLFVVVFTLVYKHISLFFLLHLGGVKGFVVVGGCPFNNIRLEIT